MCFENSKCLNKRQWGHVVLLLKGTVEVGEVAEAYGEGDIQDGGVAQIRGGVFLAVLKQYKKQLQKQRLQSQFIACRFFFIQSMGLLENLQKRGICRVILLYQIGHGDLSVHNGFEIADGTDICGVSTQKIHVEHIGF